MNSSISALRAISAVTLRRILLPVLSIAAVVFMLLYVFVIYLVSQVDAWWVLLFVVLVPITLFVIIVAMALWLASGKLFPPTYDRKHKKQITAFTGKIVGLVEHSKTPYPIHLFLIGKDIIRGKESSHIKGIINDSSSLKKDFDDIRKLF